MTGSSRQHPVDPAQHAAWFARRLCGCGSLRTTARRQVLVDRPVAHLRHQIEPAAFGDKLRNSARWVAKIAEMPCLGWAGGYARRNALRFSDVFVVDAVDAQRAFAHYTLILIKLAGTVWTRPRA